MFDRIVAFIGLITLSPFLIMTALVVVLTSKGPAFFLQERVGRHGRTFRIFKFRTMSVVTPSEENMQITVSGNMRITTVGGFLRRFKLDEIPQLINVLVGHMRLVGPRPEVQKYVDHYSETGLRTLDVKPGMTDVATLYYRNESDELAAQDDPETYYIEILLPQKLSLNLGYLESRTFMSDLVVIVLTALVSVLPGGFSDRVRDGIKDRYLESESA